MELQVEEQHNGQRIVGKAAYRAHAVDVVTGYDIRSDRWPLHIYVDGRRLEGISASAENREEALAYGADYAQKHIDDMSPRR